MSAPRRRSIRASLRRSLLAWLGVCLAIVGCGLYLYMRASLTRQFDAGLEAKARSLAALVKLEPPGKSPTIEFDFVESAHPEFSRTNDPEYFEIWQQVDMSASGPPAFRAFTRSESLGEEDLASAPVPSLKPQFEDVRLPSERRGRGVRLAVVPVDEPDPDDGHVPIGTTSRRSAPMVLMYARPRADLDRALTTLIAGLLGSGGLLSFAAGFVVWRTVTAELRPLDSLASAVASISPTALPRGLSFDSLPSEIEPVRERVSELLARLCDAFEREKRFTCSAAHELRTPIAELRALIDVRLRWPESAKACVYSLGEAKGIVCRMDAIVGSLLALARVQNGRLEFSRERVDIALALRSLIARHAERASANGTDMRCVIEEQATAEVNLAALNMMLNNLLSNAVAYTPAGGEIVVTAERAGSRVVIAVTNGPTDLSADDIPHLFEPFWRKDAARTATPDQPAHIGLGLTLVRELTSHIGSDIRADLLAQGHLCLSITI